MAKGYTNKEQAFGVGDIALLTSHNDPSIAHRVKILECFLDEAGEWWYEIEGIDLTPPVRLLTRVVPQDWLEQI